MTESRDCCRVIPDPLYPGIEVILSETRDSWIDKLELLEVPSSGSSGASESICSLQLYLNGRILQSRRKINENRVRSRWRDVLEEMVGGRKPKISVAWGEHCEGGVLLGKTLEGTSQSGYSDMGHCSSEIKKDEVEPHQGSELRVIPVVYISNRRQLWWTTLVRNLEASKWVWDQILGKTKSRVLTQPRSFVTLSPLYEKNGFGLDLVKKKKKEYVVIGA